MNKKELQVKLGKTKEELYKKVMKKFTPISVTTRFNSRYVLVMVLMLVLLMPAVAISQSPTPVDLGTAENFVVLAKSGISTTGTTAIVGDIGVSPIDHTAITGFGLILDSSGEYSTSSLVTGKIYAANYTSPTPAILTTAVSNMEAAYTDAAGRIPDYTELYTGDLTGQTLITGVYKWSNNVLISAGGVTISGSPTDVWIFEIAGNLTVANAAIIALSGGAKASNIFWQVAGQVTLGTTSDFSGIILCQTNIALQTGVAFNGRALAQTAVTLDGNSIAVNNTPPVITCPMNIVVNNDQTFCSANVTFANALATDTEDGSLTPAQTMGPTSGSNFPLGDTIVEFSVTDSDGNTATCQFTITVVDNEPPVAICQNLTLVLDPVTGTVSIISDDIDNGSTDNCGIASTTIDVSAFDCSTVGSNNVTLSVNDVNGNTSTCVAIVTVEDVTAPVVACQNISVVLDSVTGMVTVAGTDMDNGSTDTCGIVSYDLDIDTFDCSNVGENNVILTVTDVNGNTSTCAAIATVEDNTSPVLVSQDFTIEIGVDGTATLSPSDVIASNDDVCGILVIAVDITEFSCGDIGNPVTVQVYSQDNNGNISTRTATVTAVDLLAPEITCPVDHTVDSGVGNLFYILPNYILTQEATAIDNCTDPVTITSQDPAPGTALSDGVYSITITATDAYGNSSNCSFELTVESVLGTNDNSLETGIVLYPNPATNTIKLVNNTNVFLEKMVIFNINGKRIIQIDLAGMQSEKAVDVSTLPSGLYMIQIIGDKSSTVKRFIKE